MGVKFFWWALDFKCTPPSCRADRCTHSSSDNRTCTMSYDQTYPFPQVFLVGEGGGSQHSVQQPNLVPCWSFPPAQERMRNQGRSRGCGGMSTGAALVVLMLFLLVFTALGFEAYQIHNIQKELKGRQEVRGSCECRMWQWGLLRSVTDKWTVSAAVRKNGWKEDYKSKKH